MASDSLAPQQNLNFGSPNQESPSKRSFREDDTGSPVRGNLFFGSPDEGSHVRGNLFFGSPDEGSPSKRHRHYENVSKSEVVVSTPQCFAVNLGSPVHTTPLAVPLSVFLQEMASSHANVLSPSAVPKHKLVKEKLGSGSYATVFSVGEGMAKKVYMLGKNKRDRNLDNKDLWKHLSAFSRSHGNSQFARIDGITIVETDNGWEMHVEQEKCSPLTRDNVIGYIRCIISILDEYLPCGQGEVSPKDVKKSNFGVDSNGKVVCIDVDFTKNKIGEVPELVSSGEFQHGDHTMLMSFVLTILDFFETIPVDSRKDEFRRLNYTKGVLKKWGFLSDDKSVSEINIDDFREILRSIKPSNGEDPLSEDEINRLVWFLAPESQ